MISPITKVKHNITKRYPCHNAEVPVRFCQLKEGDEIILTKKPVTQHNNSITCIPMFEKLYNELQSGHRLVEIEKEYEKYLGYPKINGYIVSPEFWDECFDIKRIKTVYENKAPNRLVRALIKLLSR